MSLVAFNASAPGYNLHPAGDGPLALRRAVQDIPQDTPILILVHGYKFSPWRAARNPHRHVLALKPRRDCWKALSWPRHLGFGRNRPGEGLCIAFGWPACGTIWAAWQSAARASASLAHMIRDIQAIRPGPVHILAHSLGARVVLRAFARLPAHTVGRVILMAPAEFHDAAHAALATPAGQTAEIINIISAENRLFDCGLAALLRASLCPWHTLGTGLPAAPDRWLDLRVDEASTRAGLRRLGFRIPAPRRRICHWWAYLRPGLMLMYRDLIRRSPDYTLARLRSQIPAPPRHAAQHPAVRLLRAFSPQASSSVSVEKV